MSIIGELGMPPGPPYTATIRIAVTHALIIQVTCLPVYVSEVQITPQFTKSSEVESRVSGGGSTD